jgi:hypothetical protein
MTTKEIAISFNVPCWDGDKNEPAYVREHFIEAIASLPESQQWDWADVIKPLISLSSDKERLLNLFPHKLRWHLSK